MNGTRGEGVAVSAAGPACAHCGLPVPKVERRDDEPLQFCCGGCRAVYGALHSCGLERYYEMRARAAEVEAAPAQVTGRGFEFLDDGSFLARHAVDAGGGLRKAELRIDGVRCGACVWLLEALPRVVAGVASMRVDGARGIVRVSWDPSQVALSRIARQVDGLGYQLLPFMDPDAVERERAANRAWIVRLGVAGAIASNAMAVAFALYGGLLAEMEPAFQLFFQWMSVALAVAALAFPGRVFFANAWLALRTRTPHMDLPVAFGLAAATVAGLVDTIRGAGSIYCESAAMLVFLLLVGRFVQYGRQRRAREQVELLLAIVPSVARRVDHAAGEAAGIAERIVEVSVESLAPGDLVEIAAGDAAPADGRLSSDEAHVDLAHLTGESVPVRLERGAPVYAGARFLGAPARMEVVVAGAETRAARLLELVREASDARAPVVELANRIAGWFLVSVIALALGTILWWTPRLGLDAAFGRAIALLVVTCPCALGLATPLAVVAGIGKGARRGVLVKAGDVLERASRAGTLVLDKTGTVTEGRTEIVRWAGDREAIVDAAELEAHSAHPLARALVAFAGGAGASDRRASDVREVPGLGIEGKVGTRLVRAGSVRFMDARASLVPDDLRARAQGFALEGLAPVMVSVNGRVSAVVGVGDPVRADATTTVARLQRAGWRVVLASGDDPLVVSGVARELGLAPADALGGLSPEEKLALVRREHWARPVVMVGDGVNDLAALAAADVGVAVRDGVQASHHVADVCLAASGMRPLERFLAGARSTMRAIRVNLAVSLGYNLAGGALAFLGLVNPLVAAVLMPLSGLTVLVLALRIPSFDLPSPKGGA
jgi:Cu2+-exporting ATPase